MSHKWILVAEGSGARLFSTVGRSPELRFLREFDHPTGREKKQAFESDRPGRSFDSRGGGRHALSPEVDPHQHDRSQFVHELVAFLDKGFQNRDFSELILVAPARLLGELRNTLSKPLKQSVVEELDKNFPLRMNRAELVSHLQKDLFSLQVVA